MAYMPIPVAEAHSRLFDYLHGHPNPPLMEPGGPMGHASGHGASHGAAHAQLMDNLHGLMGHPQATAAHKLEYAKAQNLMAALQAKMHAEPQQPTSAAPGQMGGVQNPEETGYPVGQMQALPDLAALIGQHAFVPPSNPLLQALTGHFG